MGRKVLLIICLLGETPFLEALGMPTLLASSSQSNLILNADFESGDLGDLATGSLCCTHSAVIVNSPRRGGQRAVRVELGTDDPEPIVVKGPRAELVLPRESVTGDTRWYGFSLFVPSSYVEASQEVILAQWQSNGDSTERSKSPRLDLTVRGSRWVINSRSDPNLISTFQSIKRVEFPAGEIEKGEWTDWVVLAKWSYNSDGILKVWKNGQLIVSYAGPNTYNDLDPFYFKFGIYKWPWRDLSVERLADIIIYCDQVKVGNENSSHEQVAPWGAYRTKQFIPFVIDTSQFRTNLGLANLSSIATTVDLALYDEKGVAIASRSLDVPAKGLTQLNNVIRFIRGSSSDQSNDLFGSVTISSDQPLVSYATQIDNVSSDASLETGRDIGATQLLVLSTTSVGSFRSSLAIQNAGNKTGRVRLRQRDSSGVIRGNTSVSIPANGLFVSDDIHATLGVNDTFGPLEIDSTDFVPLVASSRVYAPDSKASGFFQGVDIQSASTASTIPISLDTVDHRTNLGLSNPGDLQAKVSVSLYDSDGSVLGSQEVTVPAYGFLQMNNVNRLLMKVSGVSNSVGFIRLQSNRPILGFSSVINNASNDPALALGLAAGADRVVIPSATNVNEFRSTLTVVNLGNGQPAMIRVRVRDESGSIVAQDDNITIPANGMFSVVDILARLGVSSNFGPVEINSLNDVPVAAVSQVYSISRNTGGFFLGQAF